MHGGYDIKRTHCTTVEPPIMNSPNSEKPLIMEFFQCTICILFNRFVPLNKENLQIMNNDKNWLSIIRRFHCIEKHMITVYRPGNDLTFTPILGLPVVVVVVL